MPILYGEPRNAGEFPNVTCDQMNVERAGMSSNPEIVGTDEFAASRKRCADRCVVLVCRSIEGNDLDG